MGKSKSRPEYVPGQRQFITDLFNQGGYFDQIMQGKPSQVQERAQAQGLEQLKRGLSQSGTLNQPLGTRMIADYAQKSQQGYQDEMFKNLSLGMQPGGTAVTGALGITGGKG